MSANLDRHLALLAGLNALVIVALFATALTSGISQEAFQIARLPEANVSRFLINPSGLRLGIGLDSLFIVLYTAFFVLLTIRLSDLLPATHRLVALGALLVTALLDAAENQHILAMLFSAEQKVPLSAAATQFQMAASSVKFQASYVGMFLFAFGVYRLGGLGRPLALLLWLVYVPLGVAIYMLPPDVIRPLVIARTLSFLAAFVLAALIFRRLAGAQRPAQG